MDYTIDQAQQDDWERVRLIYLEGIATGDATFETEPPDWDTWDNTLWCAREDRKAQRQMARRGCDGKAKQCCWSRVVRHVAGRTTALAKPRTKCLMNMRRVKTAITATHLTAVSLVIIIGLTISCRKADQLTKESKTAPTPLSENHKPRELTDVIFERTPARLDRGKYLTEGVLQCFICHSDRDSNAPGAPPLPGKKGAGHVWEDIPGLTAPNITPDKETGAGNWTDDMFARAIREGIGHDGRVLHPQMWYGSFRSLSDEDLASVIVYLRSLPPVFNSLPKTKIARERKPPEPLTEPVKEPDLSDQVKRGRYIVSLADCIGCHTEWDPPLTPGLFGGGNLLVKGKEKVFSSNLTGDPSGISYYDDTVFREVMRTGKVKARKLSSIMPWIAFRNLTDEDLQAVFAYLRARQPVAHAVDNTEPPTDCLVCGLAHGFGDRNRSKTSRAIAVDPKNFDAYIGQYRFDDGFLMTIEKEGDKLLIVLGTDEPKVELFAIAENEFTAKEIPDVISFIKDGQGRVTHLVSNIDDFAKKIR